MKMESAAFGDNEPIPRQYTCDGEDLSPALSWSGVPAEAKSLVLIMDDPDAPAKTFVHWVIYDLPASVEGLPEGVPKVEGLPGGGTHGKSSFGKIGYGGPCPPKGTHRYIFHLYALKEALGLPAGASRKQVDTAMKGKIVASAELTGKYGR